MLGVGGLVVPFVACGDLSGFDADMSYPLELPGLTGEAAPYTYREPTQKPINPQYHTYLQTQPHLK